MARSTSTAAHRGQVYVLLLPAAAAALSAPQQQQRGVGRVQSRSAAAAIAHVTKH